MELDCLSTEQVTEQILKWAGEPKRSRYICVSNVHQCMESFDDTNFRRVINEADMVIPDSQILAWFQHGFKFEAPQKPVRGVELMERLCEAAEQNQIVIGLYGTSQRSMDLLREELLRRYPKLRLGFAMSPPFRPLTEEEDKATIQQINGANIQLLFVGIGCPKQERWMASHKGSVHATMIGVGAAFDFLSGLTRPSPAWVHPLGLEWFYRLCIEPGRLWKRYLKQNPRFLWYCLLQKLGLKLSQLN